jgi:hypothetical protein
MPNLSDGESPISYLIFWGPVGGAPYIFPVNCTHSIGYFPHFLMFLLEFVI